MASYYPQPKPEPLAASKAARRKHKKEARDQVRIEVVSRDAGKCRFCGRYVGAGGDVHEVLMRSLGGSALDASNCVLTCRRCHAKIHKHEIPSKP